MIALLLLLLLPLASAGTVPVLELRGGVDPGSADYLVQGIADAEQAGAPAVVITMDTPGGLVTSAREIVQAELGAEVPVIVYVEPSGARAGSAGVFITLAAHVAAMAPGTTIGAAHPVQMFGGGEGEGESQQQVMQEKVLQDTLAWARAIAEQRGRDVEWAEAAVRESATLTATEAVERGVTDLVAPDLPALLEAVDGTTVQLPSGPAVLRTAGATPQVVPMTFRQQVLHLLGNPNILFVLVMGGMLGLYVEFYNPGLLVPGALGVVCLIAAGIGLSVVPFNIGGLLLLVVGFGCFLLETQTPTFGVLTAAGAVAVALGGALLFEVSGFDRSVSPALIAVTTVTAAGATLGIAWLVLRDRREQPHTGAEGLVGHTGRVLVGGTGRGRVQVHGEDWAARWTGDLQPDQPVEVEAVDGLTVHVTPLPDDGGS